MRPLQVPFVRLGLPELCLQLAVLSMYLEYHTPGPNGGTVCRFFDWHKALTNKGNCWGDVGETT